MELLLVRIYEPDVWVALLLQHSNILLCTHPYYAWWICGTNTNPDQCCAYAPGKEYTNIHLMLKILL
jgi:hypothetical protein